MQAVKNPVETGAASLEMEYKRTRGTQHSWWASAGTSSRFWVYHRYRARLYGLRIPRGACIPSNPQECTTGTHSILAILTISSTSISSSDRPGEPSTRLYTNHPFRSPSTSTFTRSPNAFLPSYCSGVPRFPLACTRSSLYPQTRRNLQTIPTRREEHLTMPEHVYSAFNSCNSTACDGYSQSAVKNINITN